MSRTPRVSPSISYQPRSEKSEATGLSDIQAWPSPAFLKRKRPVDLSFGVSYDPFTDNDEDIEGLEKKRSRFSRPSGQWRFAERRSSPEKDVEEHTLDNADSPSTPEIVGSTVVEHTLANVPDSLASNEAIVNRGTSTSSSERAPLRVEVGQALTTVEPQINGRKDQPEHHSLLQQGRPGDVTSEGLPIENENEIEPSERARPDTEGPPPIKAKNSPHSIPSQSNEQPFRIDTTVATPQFPTVNETSSGLQTPESPRLRPLPSQELPMVSPLLSRKGNSTLYIEDTNLDVGSSKRSDQQTLDERYHKSSPPPNETDNQVSMSELSDQASFFPSNQQGLRPARKELASSEMGDMSVLKSEEIGDNLDSNGAFGILPPLAGSQETESEYRVDLRNLEDHRFPQYSSGNEQHGDVFGLDGASFSRQQSQNKDDSNLGDQWERAKIANEALLEKTSISRKDTLQSEDDAFSPSENQMQVMQEIVDGEEVDNTIVPAESFYQSPKGSGVESYNKEDESTQSYQNVDPTAGVPYGHYIQGSSVLGDIENSSDDSAKTKHREVDSESGKEEDDDDDRENKEQQEDGEEHAYKMQEESFNLDKGNAEYVEAEEVEGGEAEEAEAGEPEEVRAEEPEAEVEEVEMEAEELEMEPEQSEAESEEADAELEEEVEVEEAEMEAEELGAELETELEDVEVGEVEVGEAEESGEVEAKKARLESFNAGEMQAGKQEEAEVVAEEDDDGTSNYRAGKATTIDVEKEVEIIDLESSESSDTEEVIESVEDELRKLAAQSYHVSKFGYNRVPETDLPNTTASQTSEEINQTLQRDGLDENDQNIFDKDGDEVLSPTNELSLDDPNSRTKVVERDDGHVTDESEQDQMYGIYYPMLPEKVPKDDDSQAIQPAMSFRAASPLVDESTQVLQESPVAEAEEHDVPEPEGSLIFEAETVSNSEAEESSVPQTEESLIPETQRFSVDEAEESLVSEVEEALTPEYERSVPEAGKSLIPKSERSVPEAAEVLQEEYSLATEAAQDPGNSLLDPRLRSQLITPQATQQIEDIVQTSAPEPQNFEPDNALLTPRLTQMQSADVQEPLRLDRSSNASTIARLKNLRTSSGDLSRLNRSRSTRMSQWFTPTKPSKSTVASEKEVSSEEVSDYSKDHSHPAKSVLADSTATKTPIVEISNSAAAQAPLSGGFRTALSYYIFLSAVSEYFNATIDTVAVVVSSTNPVRATSGPRDFDQTIYLTDTSTLPRPKLSTAQLFRPSKDALPLVQSGDILLLRDFKVQTQNRGFMLLSTESSAWAVFRQQEGVQIRGPPVELGVEEREFAKGLRRWWDNLKEEGREEVRKLVPKPLMEENRKKKGKPHEEKGVTSDRRGPRNGTALTNGFEDDSLHELRDGTTWKDGESDDGLHELRDGTTWKDGGS